MIVLDRQPVTEADPEALFKEARRRRRRRWLVGSCVVLVVVAIAAAFAVTTGGNLKGPSTGISHPLLRLPKPSIRTQGTGVNAVPVEYSPAQSMGLADRSLAWITTGNTLEVTTDGGLTWRTITPLNLHGVTVSEDVTAVDAVGSNDLWVVISDVPGLVTPNNGSSRGEGIDESTDGGKSWTFVALPGCIQSCGSLSLSMVDARERLRRHRRAERCARTRLLDPRWGNQLDSDLDHSQSEWRRSQRPLGALAAGLHE